MPSDPGRPIGSTPVTSTEVADTPPDGGFRDALRRLGSVQKSGRGAPPYSRWINRRIGRWLAALAFVAGLTPNAVTLISACATFSGLILIAIVDSRWWLGLVSCALLLLGYTLDSADGQLARLRGGSSKSGEWLDHVVDATKVCILHSVVLISFYRFTVDPAPLLLLVPLGYQVVSSVFFFSFILIEQLRKDAGRSGTPGAPKTGAGFVQSIAALPTDYATLCLCFVLFGWHSAFIAVYEVLFLVNALILAAALLRWWREMRALDRAPAR